MKIAIVTGVSKGLGKSIATFLLESGIHVYGISRTENKELLKAAEENSTSYTHFSCDLGQLEAASQTIEKIIRIISSGTVSQLYVVNNAAVVGPIDKAMNMGEEELSRHYNVNAISPMMILNSMLSLSNEKQVSLIGVNITSGAAERPIYGWSAYCSSKASINMYTKAVALEQEEMKTENKVIAFNPGVMDTEVQAEIRASDYDQFIDVETFKNYKRKDLLSDTEAVAGVLVDILTDKAMIQNGKIYNVADYF